MCARFVKRETIRLEMDGQYNSDDRFILYYGRSTVQYSIIHTVLSLTSNVNRSNVTGYELNVIC